MSMKPEEMFKAVVELSHESFEESTWLLWFNEALQDLAPVLKLETYEEFAVTGSDERDLPGDVFEIVKFVLANGSEETELAQVAIGDKNNKNAYWLWDGTAYFPEEKTGTCKLWYYRRPARFTLGSSSPDIQPGYEDLLILYAAAKSKAPDRWLSDKDDFYRDYMLRKQQVALERNRQLRRPRYVKTIPFTAGGRFR